MLTGGTGALAAVMAYPPGFVRWRPMETGRFLLVMSAVAATILIFMSALSPTWYVIYDRWDFGPGELDEEWYIFGLAYLEEVFVCSCDGEREVYRESYYYDDDWYWEPDEIHPQVAGNTGTVVWTSIAFVIAYLILTMVFLFIATDRWSRPLRVATSLIGIVSAILLVGALAYFGTEFPVALGQDLDDWGFEDEQRGFGAAFYTAIVACVMLLIGAFYLLKGLWTESSQIRSAPIDARGK
jgi:hypothetical protein